MTSAGHAQQQPPDRAPAGARLRPPAHQAARRVIAQWTVEYLVDILIAYVSAWVVVAVVEWAGWSSPGAILRHIRWLPSVVALAGLAWVAAVPAWRYRLHRWEVGSDVVYTRTGWFSRHWQLVPVSRIQTVDTRQSWIERPLGLATLHIRTASHAGSSKVAGLPVGTATLLAADLAHRAHELRDDAT